MAPGCYHSFAPTLSQATILSPPFRSDLRFSALPLNRNPKHRYCTRFSKWPNSPNAAILRDLLFLFSGKTSRARNLGMQLSPGKLCPPPNFISWDPISKGSRFLIFRVKSTKQSAKKHKKRKARNFKGGHTIMQRL